jgi:hypothetical protein
MNKGNQQQRYHHILEMLSDDRIQIIHHARKRQLKQISFSDIEEKIRYLELEKYDIFLDVQAVANIIKRLEQQIERSERRLKMLERKDEIVSQFYNASSKQHGDPTGQDPQEISHENRHHWMQLIWESLQDEILTGL